MRLYSVHLRRSGLDPDRDLVLVKEGFCWPAFFFSVLWSLWHGLGWGTLILLGIVLLPEAAAVALGADPLSSAVLSLSASIVVGLLGNELRRWTLGRHGFNEVGVVGGRDREAAERRFLDAAPALAAEMRT